MNAMNMSHCLFAVFIVPVIQQVSKKGNGLDFSLRPLLMYGNMILFYCELGYP